MVSLALGLSALQKGPDGLSSSGSIAVGDGRTRTEMTHQGEQIVRISDESRGVDWILFPARKSYMEQPMRGPGGADAKPSADDPCAGMPGLTCRKTGEEVVSGRAALVWEIVATHQGKVMTGTQWIDKERGPAFMLKQQTPNGQTMERALEGPETLAGRQTEKWRIDMTGPDGQTMSTFEWYDPELEMSIKQEFPGGMVSEVKNIRLGPQPDHLFSIPAGYERVSVPQGVPGGAAPQR